MKIKPSIVLDRCPHCGIAHPALTYPKHRGSKNVVGPWINQSNKDGTVAAWAVYECGGCGGCVLAGTSRHPEFHALELSQLLENGNCDIGAIYPSITRLNTDLPPKALRFLQQAVDTLHAPDGAVMLAASSIDAMLKEIGLVDGSLYKRIERARDEGKITADMAAWAHQVRLDANDPRHADENFSHHDPASAKRAVDFARALGEFLFVLPKRVTRGIQEAQGKLA